MPTARKPKFDIGPIPLIVTSIPRRGISGPDWGFQITEQLVQIWKGLLDERESENFEQWRQDPNRELPACSILNKLDALIIAQSETPIGWRIYLSWLVQWRLAAWERDSEKEHLFEEVGRAITKGARVARGDALPPLEPALYTFRKNLIAEMRDLLRNLRNALALSTGKPSTAELIELFESAADAGEASPNLKQNLAQWVEFFTKKPLVIAQFLNLKPPSPSSLVDSWLAWCTGYEQEVLRQKISILGNRVARPRAASISTL